MRRMGFYKPLGLLAGFITDTTHYGPYIFQGCMSFTSPALDHFFLHTLSRRELHFIAYYIIETGDETGGRFFETSSRYSGGSSASKAVTMVSELL